MDTIELSGYGVPPGLVTIWREQQGERLLPLQEKAVREFALLGEGNLLVQAPASSGKTFVGEMAAAHAALHRRKTVYLLPIKTLAEEKYRAFEARYGRHGARVIVCTRDHRSFDCAFERGDYDIAVAVYEKLEQLSTVHPERLRELSLVVADELEVLSDSERGAAAELLLTRLHLLGVRIVGLSAVLGVPEQPAAWLGAQLLVYDRRPVELRYGVLFEGAFRYCGHNNPDEGEEKLEASRGNSSWDAAATNVTRLTESGESCLVFVKACREARHGAELLAQRLSLPAASATIETLRGLESTRARDALLCTLETGTAFHNADLLPDERRAVESGFRKGEIKALAATSTLAVGMNLPAHNVFLSSDKWLYDPNLDLPWRAPISQGEFENMSEQAGRYGGARDYGRAVLVATSPFDRDTLWRRYIKGLREPVRPQLAQAPLEEPILQLVAAHSCRTLPDIEAFFAQTLSARMVCSGRYNAEETGFRIRAALHRCISAGMVHAVDDGGATTVVTDDTPLDTLTYEAAPTGRVVAAKGIWLTTARALLHWLRLSEQRDWLPLDLLTALAMLPNAGLRQVSLTHFEYENADYPGRLKRLTTTQELVADTPLNRLRTCRIAPFYDEVRAVKTALFLADWIEQTPLRAIEAEYAVSAGQLLGAAGQLSWLSDAASALADAQQYIPAFVETLRDYSDRLRFGAAVEALPVARAVHGLSRRSLLKLASARLLAPAAIHDAAPAVLERFMTPSQARTLKQWAHAELKASPAPAAQATPVLTIDARRPGEVELNGVAISLQEKQYRLITALAARPGTCVPYADIYRSVWGDAIVEDNQMHYQKRMLVKRLAKAGANNTTLIGVVPKHGFILNLAPEQVRIIKTAGHAA